MKLLLAIFSLLFFFTGAEAQIQFWNINDLEDENGNAIRKEAKVYQVAVYRTDEKGNIKDSAEMEDLLTYDESGRLIARVHYNYDWAKRKPQVQHADSFWYYRDGSLFRYRAYEEPQFKLMRETETLVNRKGQVEKWHDYSYLEGYKKPDGYQAVKYNPKNKITEVNWYGEDRKKTNTQTFVYDAAGRLIRDARKYNFGTPATYNITRDAKGAIQKYEELYGKQLQKKLTYTYDANGRRLKKTTTSTSGYDDFTEYYYEGSSKLVNRSYLQYSGTSDGRPDRRHEYRTFVYRYY